MYCDLTYKSTDYPASIAGNSAQVGGMYIYDSCKITDELITVIMNRINFN
jgi:hypothetical protein